MLLLRLLTRAVLQELRRLLDDDEDMADMFLDRAQDLPASPLNSELGAPSMQSGLNPMASVCAHTIAWGLHVWGGPFVPPCQPWAQGRPLNPMTPRAAETSGALAQHLAHEPGDGTLPVKPSLVTWQLPAEHMCVQM